MDSMHINRGNNRLHKTGIALFLFIIVFAAYWQVGGHEFISYDDPEYITDNSAVRQGLTFGSIIWAFTTFHASNWHPITWLSHMLDIELFGMNPAGHHIVNVILHSINSILLFLLLNRYTRFLWRSAAVAALFALHPLHVESVAWAAERKDVLSALFWMLTLYHYAGYVQKPNLSKYFITVTFFTLGLMAKPMLVTLPVVMLLLDYWPLRRFESALLKDTSYSAQHSPWYLCKEKLPFLALVIGACTVTIYAQKAALSPLSNTTILSRIFNAATAYQLYLGKMLLPRNLAVFYPFNHALPGLQVLSAIALLCVVSITVVYQRQTRPYLFVGWFWYIITLVPVIGIIQVGMQAMADRYTYIPLIGIFLLAVWGIAEATTGWAYQRIALSTLIVASITACTLTTWQQVSYWKNSATLFNHALTSTHKNFIAHFLLGCESEKQGKLDEAVTSYKATLTDNPYYGAAYGKLGKINYESGKLDDAIEYYYKELFVSPLSVNCRNNLGIALAENGKLDEAINHFTHALSLKPDFIQAQDNLKRALEKHDTKKAYR
jgi:tetratricopeptide (TPR) repeat protein